MKKLRFIALFLASLTVIILAAGCMSGGSDTTAAPVPQTDGTTEEASREPETTEPETYDPALDVSELVKDEDGNVDVKPIDPGLFVGVDGLGRTLLTHDDVGDVREDKTVGIFYSSWHGDFADEAILAYNNQEILDKYPDINKNNFNDSRWGTAHYHFWNEPVYGYYSGNDEWVIRRQAELLADAGVDCVICDNTNGAFTWMTTAKKLMKVFHEARVDGVKAPTVTFLLPFGATDGARSQINKFYEQIYKAEYYPDSWTMWDGKPLIIGYKSCLDRSAENYKEISKFFTWREGQPDYRATQTASGQWGWLSLYPQATYKAKMKDKTVEEITVGVAQNYNWKKKGLTAMNGDDVTDRTYTSKGYDTQPNAELYGANFAEQFEYALEVDPRFIFITGWNEWVAIRQREWPPAGHSAAGVVGNAFADQFDDIASRDIEPTRGRLLDHYYYQMVNFIRRYKGVNALPASSSAKTIDINGGFGQWANVLPEYNSYQGNTGNRAALGYGNPAGGGRFRYKDESGRNDIYDMKVAQDKNNVYFMVRCVDDITPYTDENWMRLYIDTGDSEKSWEGFEFILNKTSPSDDHTASLCTFTGSGFETEAVCDVQYSVKGNVLAVSIPRSALGIGEGKFTVDFKWADNSADGDVMDFYTKGDAAPGGRFRYRYTSE